MAKKKETKTKQPSVVYRDIATGKIYTTMPKGYIRYSDLDAKGKRAADEIQNEAFPYNALSNYGSEGVVVYPNRKTLEDADTSWHLADPTETDKNMFHRANVAAEDKRVARSSNFEAALNFTSPITYIGALFDAAQGKKSFIDSMLDGNSGIVTDKFQQEHPYLSMGINFLGDLAAGALVDKALKGAVSLSRVKPINVIDDVATATANTTKNGYLSNLNSGIQNAINTAKTKLSSPPALGQEVPLHKILGRKRVRRINSFMKKDVKDRMIRTLEDEGIPITDDINKVLNMKAPKKVKLAPASPVEGASYDPNTKTIYINNQTTTYPRDIIEEIMVHEMEHNQTDLMHDAIKNNLSKMLDRFDNSTSVNSRQTRNNARDTYIDNTSYSPKANNALNEAYKFTNPSGSDVLPTLEKGATNRELRYLIHKVLRNRTGKNYFGVDLDNAIDGMSYDEIFSNAVYNGKIPSAYTKDFLMEHSMRGLSKQQIADKVKHSLKYVPAIISTLMGGAAIGNNIRNEQMR